jgi:hypothetical protein
MKRLLLSAIICMATGFAAMQAQDSRNPWHLTVYDENDAEVAFYNTERIVDIETSAQTATVVFDDGQKFPHPIATTSFGFDPRATGTGTANENIDAPEWTVSYSNGNLHFSEPVNGVAIYNMLGALADKRFGAFTDVSINLNAGVYIVQAGGSSTKLFVSKNGFGGAVTQPKSVATQLPAYADPVVSLRAGGIKTYWNIKHGDMTTPVEMSNVAKFYFTADGSLVFVLKNGNTVELTDYKGVEFTIEPAATTNSNWDMEKTLKFGGAAYMCNSSLEASMWFATKCVSIFLKDQIVIYNITNNVETKYPIKFLPEEGRVSAFYNDIIIGIIRGFIPSFSYKAKLSNGLFAIRFLSIENGDFIGSTLAQNWKRGDNLIDTTYKIDKNGNIVAIYDDGEYTFVIN